MKLRKSLPSLSRFTFGTGRLAIKGSSFAEDVKLVRSVMETGVWFHSSSDYEQGGVFNVLRAAFAESPQQKPPCIIKVYCPTAETARAHVEEILRNLGTDRIEIAQLCSNADFAEDFRTQGPRWELFQDLQSRGVIGNYLSEIFAGDSTNALELAKAEAVDAYTYYYNLIDRQISNELADFLQQKQLPVLALRTVGGRNVDFDSFSPGGDDATSRIIGELKPLFYESGSRNWTEFNVRFLLSQPNILTTIGATSSRVHLAAFFEAERNFQPLAPALIEAIHALHSRAFATFGKS